MDWDHVLQLVSDAAVAAQRAHDYHGSDDTAMTVWLIGMVREDLRLLRRELDPASTRATCVGPLSHWR